MKRELILIFAIVVAVTSFAQSGKEKADQFMKTLADKTAAYETIEINFVYKMVNEENGINESQEGKLLLKGESYRLAVAGQIVICDGEQMWTVLPDAEEVNLSIVDEDSEFSNPRMLLGQEYENYKCKINDKQSKETNLTVVDLRPKESKSYYQLTLYCHPTTYKIDKMEIFDKNGTVFTYQVEKFEVDQPLSDQLFIYSEEVYPGYELIDLR